MRPAGTPESEPKSPTRKARRGEAGQACEERSFTVAVRNVDRPSGPPHPLEKGERGCLARTGRRPADRSASSSVRVPSAHPLHPPQGYGGRAQSLLRRTGISSAAKNIQKGSNQNGT